MTVLAAGHWRTNGELLAHVAQLYIRPDDKVLDPTYGKGGFWTKLKPAHLIGTDIVTPTLNVPGVDFRDLPFPDETFDVVVFDPPYVSKGGRETSTIHQMNDAYGMNTTERTPQAQFANVIRPGLNECGRVLKPGGLLMVKAMPYITSGRYQDAPHDVKLWMADSAIEVVDQFVFVRPGPGPQPTTNLDGSPRRVMHARNNYSLLIIGRKK